VTAVLEDVGLGPDLSMVPAAVLAAALERGKEVHRILEADAYGYLEPADVTPELAPYYSAYQKWLAESRVEHIASEFSVEHPVWSYCGHPDRLCWWNGKRAIVDFKSGAKDGADVQVAAYVEAFNAQHPTERVLAGYVVELREDGTYRIHTVDLAAAAPLWFAALMVWRARRGMGR
jgi:hypothetical protein